ncbi:MAG: TIGR04255 family protein [Terriglobia bacterium]|nr:TIGR04255 family protein [Terriglobia bacterium]
MNEFVIDLEEQFENLPKAPIVEAVIDIRAMPADRPREEALRNFVESEFADYKFLNSQREFQFRAQFSSNALPNQVTKDLGWKGLRFQSDDRKYIAQFNRDGFVLSRLEPYETWEKLSREAKRLWSSYIEFLKPLQIDRVGLRYVNRIQLPFGEVNFEEYLQVSPSTPPELDFPISGFMHQDSVVVPNNPYAINIIKTIQPPNLTTGTGLGLILDIDVGTTQFLEMDDIKLGVHLSKMRWLKNKVFFGSIKRRSLEMFR